MSTRIHAAWLAAALAAGCAVGEGEAATGLVETSVVPGGTASGGVRFEQARLGIARAELVQEEEADGGGHGHDHGHGHAHLAQGLGQLSSAVTLAGAAVDLLGGPVGLGATEVPAGPYEAVQIRLAPRLDGDAAGCTLFATGSFGAGDDAVPVRICVPGSFDAEAEAHFDVGLDEEKELELVFSVNEILTDVPVAALGRSPDGSIVIDAGNNPAFLVPIRDNLTQAFRVHVP